MAKSSKLKPAPSAKTPGTFKDRNLAGTNPVKEQFEPTAAAPVNQHKRMAGAA